MKRIEDIMQYVEEHHLYPDLHVIDGAAEPEVIINGKKVLMFSSNNYLGLATHPKVVAAAIEATKKYGVGSGGSRMLSGNLQVHREYELAIAKFKGGEDAIVFSTGYQTNLGVISAVMNPFKVGPYDFFRRRSVILSDDLNHASIVDGAKASGQKVVVYKHCDMNDLEKKLKKFKHRRKLVVTDGVFSMEGDIAPLDKIVTLCKKYNSLLMVDEAHATGVIGKNGHGTLEHFNLKPTTDVDIVMGTHSKALSSVGGFVVGSKNLIKYLRIASRPYIFSAALPPAVSASLITSLEVIESEPNLRVLLNKKSDDLRAKLNTLGFDTLGSQTQIVPVLIGEDEQAIEFSRMLLDKGIYAPCVRWPAVPKHRARLRLTVMSTHSNDQIAYLIKCCELIGKELKILS
ncbi:MAG: 8-amino-7-oxononanoate synthase [bacterium]|nr:8-amino-7-oxononanoate synthase [bacterium]